MFRQLVLDFRGEASGHAGMADDTHSIVEEAVLTAVSERLEQALELAAGQDAVSQLETIAALCDEVAHIARGGALLLA